MLFAPLQTERLTLRLHSPSDIPALMPLIGAREVAATTLRIPHPYTESDAQDFMADTKEELLNGSGLRLGIVVRQGDPYWGKGYATEAAGAMVNYGFKRLGLHRIFASHLVDNSASARVLRKIGMRHEGTQRGHILKWGKFLDLEMYGMLASDLDSAA
jgi:RimJ/RimL family protein N-acetyltransferase